MTFWKLDLHFKPWHHVAVICVVVLLFVYVVLRAGSPLKCDLRKVNKVDGLRDGWMEAWKDGLNDKRLKKDGKKDWRPKNLPSTLRSRLPFGEKYTSLSSLFRFHLKVGVWMSPCMELLRKKSGCLLHTSCLVKLACVIFLFLCLSLPLPLLSVFCFKSWSSELTKNESVFPKYGALKKS